MVGKTYEIWEATTPSGGSEISLLEPWQFEAQKHLFSSVPVLLATFRAQNYTEAAQMRNDFFGWGPYHPMKEDLEHNDGKDNI